MAAVERDILRAESLLIFDHQTFRSGVDPGARDFLLARSPTQSLDGTGCRGDHSAMRGAADGSPGARGGKTPGTFQPGLGLQGERGTYGGVGCAGRRDAAIRSRFFIYP